MPMLKYWHPKISHSIRKQPSIYGHFYHHFPLNVNRSHDNGNWLYFSEEKN